MRTIPLSFVPNLFCVGGHERTHRVGVSIWVAAGKSRAILADWSNWQDIELGEVWRRGAWTKWKWLELTQQILSFRLTRFEVQKVRSMLHQPRIENNRPHQLIRIRQLKPRNRQKLTELPHNTISRPGDSVTFSKQLTCTPLPATPVVWPAERRNTKKIHEIQSDNAGCYIDADLYLGYRALSWLLLKDLPKISGHF